MSENQDRKLDAYAKYDAMETEALEELLRFDAHTQGDGKTDVDAILYILEVLEDRGRNKDQLTGKTALEAFESFKQNYLPEEIHIEPVPEAAKPEKKPLRWMRGLTAAAAVLAFVILGSVTASAFGFNIWKAVAVWAQETFRLESDVKAESELPDPGIVLPYASLEEAIYALELKTGIVPTWIPEGYVLTDIRIDENPMRKKYIGVYSNGEKEIKIVVQSYQNAYPEQIEQSDGTEETYVSNGVIFHFFEDIDTLQAVWIQDSYECYVSGSLTVEQMEMMIDSISKG